MQTHVTLSRVLFGAGSGIDRNACDVWSEFEVGAMHESDGWPSNGMDVKVVADGCCFFVAVYEQEAYGPMGCVWRVPKGSAGNAG